MAHLYIHLRHHLISHLLCCSLLVRSYRFVPRHHHHDGIHTYQSRPYDSLPYRSTRAGCYERFHPNQQIWHLRHTIQDRKSSIHSSETDRSMSLSLRIYQRAYKPCLCYLHTRKRLRLLFLRDCYKHCCNLRQFLRYIRRQDLKRPSGLQIRSSSRLPSSHFQRLIPAYNCQSGNVQALGTFHQAYPYSVHITPVRHNRRSRRCCLLQYHVKTHMRN